MEEETVADELEGALDREDGGEEVVKVAQCLKMCCLLNFILLIHL